jgi:predicted alpha/beta hydrolase
VRATDGYELAADLYLPDGGVRAAVLVAPAMGVPRRLYGAFSAYLAEAGLATLVLDYRGIGGSAPRSLRGFAARLGDWGERDLAGAVAELARRFPGLPLLWAGHSVGGQLMGLVPDLPVRAAVFVASQSGWHGHWPGAGRWAMAALWHLVLPALVHAVGYLPMKAFGQGENVPAGVALEWAAWGRDRDYVWGYARRRGGVEFPRFSGPILAYGFADDPYAPRPAVEALLGFYRAARPELRWLRPADLGTRSIGHFGFFGPRFRDRLWSEVRSFLLDAVGDARPRSA